MYKKYFEGKKAVLFDLDGTVVKETEELNKQSFESVLKELNAGYIDPRPYCITGTSANIRWEAILYANKLPEKKSVKELVERTRTVYLEMLKNAEMETTEGFWDMVYELKKEKNFKLGLTTNTGKTPQEVIFQKLGISEVFDIVICGDDVKRLKPHPEIYQKALKKLGVKPRETLAFEDSIAGAESAGNAGIDTIIIWDEETPKRVFKGKIIDFTTDFTLFPGNMDETQLEYLARDFKESETTIKEV